MPISVVMGCCGCCERMRRARTVKATIPSAGETLDLACRIPLLEQEGWTRHQTLERRGRRGHSGRTTPSALSKVASQLFLDAQPPLLCQEGCTLARSAHSSKLSPPHLTFAP